MNKTGITTMTKKELRERMAADAARWIQQNGSPDLYAAASSPQEHFQICGNKYKRKPVKTEDPVQVEYKNWVQAQTM
jgi:hypothetical protein